MDKTTIELFKEAMKFSAAHFTLFSRDSRERLHGHNFQVYVAVTMWRHPDGLTLDYRQLKNLILHLCSEWDEYLLLPTKSPYLTVTEREKEVDVVFNDQKMCFLKDDVKLLPISNITVEELSYLFLQEIQAHPLIQKLESIQAIKVKISSGNGQWGECEWCRES